MDRRNLDSIKNRFNMVKARKAVLIAASIAIVASFLFISYMLGYGSGFTNAYGDARADVCAEAWGAGYACGFKEGNLTGFEDGYAAGEEGGYEAGYRQGVEDGAGRGVTLRDPAYSEAEAFIEHDGTDGLRYSPEGYTFLDLAAKFKANAMASGFRCAAAVLLLDNGVAVLNCFNTTDRGLIYAEPWSDQILTLKVGGHYGAGMVLKVTLVW